MSKERMHGVAVFDADGTLIDRNDPDIHNHRVPAETIQGLEDLREQGMYTTVCTSNGISELVYKLQTLHKGQWWSSVRRLISPDTPIDISSGANIIDRRGRSLHSEPIPQDILSIFADVVPFLSAEYVAITTIPPTDSDKREVVDFFCHTLGAYTECKKKYTVRSRVHADRGGLYGKAIEHLFTTQPLVVTIKLGKNAPEMEIPDYIPHQFHASGFVDIFSPKTSKLNASYTIASMLNVPLKVTGGNDRNDVPFFRGGNEIKIAVGGILKELLHNPDYRVQLGISDEIYFADTPLELGLILQALAASDRLFDPVKGWHLL